MVKATPDSVKNMGTGIAGIGLIGLAFFVLTYIQFYDDIGILEKRGSNEDSNGDILTTADMPLGMLLQLEMLGALVMCLGGLFGVFGFQNKSARSGIFIATVLAFAAFVFTGIYRTATLWGESEGQCKYFGDPDIHGQTGDYIKACPATRHENQGPTSTSGFWNYTHIEPTLRSDCVFWFWDNTFTLESALVSASGGSGVGAGITIEPSKKEALKNEMIENMDWTQKHMYGYFMVDSPCNNDLGATDCIPDGRTVFETIETNARVSDEYGVSIVRELPGPAGNKLIPDISYCYYWGCSKDCNPDRYRINRLLLYAAMAMGLFSLLFSATAGTYAMASTAGYGMAIATLAPTNDLEAPVDEKWKPMPVKSLKRRGKGDSRTLRF